MSLYTVLLSDRIKEIVDALRQKWYRVEGWYTISDDTITIHVWHSDRWDYKYQVSGLELRYILHPSIISDMMHRALIRDVPQYRRKVRDAEIEIHPVVL